MKKLLHILLIPALFACVSSEDAINPDDLDKWERFNTSDGLGSNDVTKLFEDGNNILWIGTSNGIASYNGSFQSFSGPEAPSGRINTITQDSNGDILAGTSNGLGIYSNNAWQFFDLLDGNPFGVSALYTASDGSTWMGTEQGEIRRFTTGGLSGNLYNAFVFDFAETSSGLILVGMIDGFLVYDGSNFSAYTGFENSDAVLSFEEDDFGTVWMGTLTGDYIYILDFNGTTPDPNGINLYNSNDINAIVTIETLRNGNVWLGTLGAGILMYDGLIMRTNFDSGGPGAEGVIESILQTEDGDIWVATGDAGLYKYIPE